MALLEGKVAVVTGAGRGLGRAEALALAAAGAKVVVNDLGCDLFGSGAETMVADEVVKELVDAGSEAVADYSDVTTMDGVDLLMWRAINKFGRLDILINNAGIIRDRTLLNMTEDEWDALMSVHLKGAFLCTRAAGRIMKAQGGGGAVINTSSISALIGSFGHPNYATAKGGIYGFVRGTAAELARFGVRVNAIVPHAFSRMTTSVEWMRDKQDVYSTDVLGPTIVFLASDLGKDITGRVIGAVGGKEGVRVCEFKMAISEGYVTAADELSPTKIGENIEKVLSPLPDLSGDNFLKPVKA